MRLIEFRGSSIGPHVLDYFKHVSPKSLKTMGLALISETGDAETRLLYSICVNSAAYKFINTILSEGDGGGIEVCMRNEAARYLQSVQLAMTRISLLSPPSLLFLQSLLCSVRNQGSSTFCGRTELLTNCRLSSPKDKATRCTAGHSFLLPVKPAKIST